MNEKKLIEYGFQDWQIKELFTRGKIGTSHGTYRVGGSNLYLHKKDINGKDTIKKVM